MKRITVELLQEKGACSNQVAVFKKLWPRGIVPSLKAIRQAQKAELDLDWVARNLLSEPALKAYLEATAAACKAYNEATAAACKAFNEATAPARKAYNEAKVKALWKAMKEDE